MWKAHLAESFTFMGLEIRLADLRREDAQAVIGADGGDATIETLDRGVEVPVFVRLPFEAVEALRDALNGHMPPSDDKDLRDALAVERERVDRILDRAIRPTE